MRAIGSIVGRRILLTGASGGVGHYFVELASLSGAEITAISWTAERGSRLRALAAHCVLTDLRDVPGVYDVVLESVGGASFNEALSRVAPRGLLVWFGQASRTPVTIDFFSFFKGRQSATIRHFDYTDSATPDAEDLRTLARLAEAGRLHPELGSVSPWGSTAARIADLRARRVRGKAILTL
jgi:NADPH2:quinone reductase